MPRLQSEFGLSIFESSAIPVTLTMAVMIGNIVSALMVGRIGHKRLFLIAAILGLAATSVIFVFSGYAALLAGMILLGLSTGAAFTSMTSIYTSLPDEYQNFGMYHAFFGLGGMSAPIFSAWMIRQGVSVSGLFGVYAILFAVLILLNFIGAKPENIRFREVRFIDMAKTLMSPIIRMSVLTLAIYASMEMGLTTWASNMAVDGYGLTELQSSSVLSTFWLLYTISRFFTDVIARLFGPMKFTFAMSLLSIVIVGIWVSGAGHWIMASLGLLFGPMFPAMQKYINSHLPAKDKGLFNGITYASTGIGGSLVVFAMGSVSGAGMAAAFLVVLGLAAVFSVLVMTLRARMEKIPVRNAG